MPETTRVDAAKIVSGVVSELSRSQGGTNFGSVDKKVAKEIPSTQGAKDVVYPDDSDVSPTQIGHAKGEHRTRDFGQKPGDGISDKQFDEYGDYY